MPTPPAEFPIDARSGSFGPIGNIATDSPICHKVRLMNVQCLKLSVCSNTNTVGVSRRCSSR